jgi:hypothetical protein
MDVYGKLESLTPSTVINDSAVSAENSIPSFYA